MKSITLPHNNGLLSFNNVNYTDDCLLTNPIGNHNICNGFIDIMKISDTFKVVLCRKCFFRFTIPNDIVTYGQLKKHFESTIIK